MKRPITLSLLLLTVALGGCDRIVNPAGRLTLSGTLELTEHSVGARVAGRLTTAPFQEGDAVEAGQLLATLDRLDQAQREYERLAKLIEQGGAAQQAVEQAALAVEDQQILSPVEGTVLVKVREAGEVVAPGDPVAVVGDRRQLWIRVYVPEGAVSRVRTGQPAVVRIDGLRETFRGRVSFVASQAEFTPRNVQTPEERVTQVFAVKVAVEEPPPSLRPGVAADVVLDLTT